LTSGAPYNYQVSAFDFVNNESPLSPALGLQTFITSGSSATNLVATVVSAQEISLSWSAPTNTNGLSSYLIYAGTSPSNLQQIAVRPAGTLTYNNMNLAAGTTYFYGIVAVEQGIQAPMSNNAYGITLPLPTPPSSVTGAPAPTKVVLTWQENLQPGGKPISFYEVFQGTTPGNLTKVASATGTTYTAASLTPNTTYYFEIVAVDNASPHDYSPPSDQMAVMTLPLPAAPVITSVTANSAARITVAWSETVPAGGLSISSYTIFRGTSPTGLTKLATRGPSPLTFTDTTGITPGTTYYYSMEATDSGQDVSPMSTVAMVTTPPLPAAPVITSVTATPAKVTINFTETVPPGGLPVTSFKIYRGTSPTSLALLTTRSASPFYDTAVSPNTIYFYALTATDSGGDVSAESTITSVTTPPLPAAPVNVGATANSTSQITVTWSENIPPGGLPVTSYSIYRGTTPTGLTKLTARSTTTYIDTGLTPATTYYYAITATDSGGDVSAMSATANATTP
jgi:titin